MIHKYRMFFDGKSYLKDFPDHPEAGVNRMIGWDELLLENDDPIRAYFNNECAGCSPLMQFTGLTDKNGVEIYRKDKLKSGRTGLIYIVEWDDESASFTSLCTDPEEDFCMNPYAWGGAEVIGNDYEPGEQP